MSLSHFNPSIGTLSKDIEESQDKVKETNLFGGSFLEKAMKRIEALAKVTGTRNGPSHKCQQNQDPNDLCRFLERGAPAKCGGRNIKHQQPYPPKFQKKGRFPPKELLRKN